ncbi:hypothetical protein MTR67_045577 [Solanum verrucosum]|uniref:Trichome birefringence-like N-terminal domain-containing protein n=1 Tax=Solanum verrucosum TaxID=315347 RepID=A0AAF0UTA1_SOLVR|nr:hypothetical protein MTR67_045577 [Solanum verrucosum]
MHKWPKKKTQYPLIALVFFIFIVFSILYNEIYIHEIQSKHSTHHTDDDDSSTSAKEEEEDPLFQSVKNLTLPRIPPVPLDKSSACHSTVKYSGKRAEWDSFKPESGGRREMPETCDYFSGEWVFDNSSHPLYKESDCPYMSDQLACHKHGRQDLEYQYWRWQPHNCNLKRWNVTEMWEKLRGKRLMFVGDSLNRGQWISMVCLMQSVIPADKKFMTPQAHLSIFRAEEYNASIEFLWAPLLVESNSDDPVDHRLSERILRPDSLLRHSSEWMHADILVFNSYLWWRQGPVKLLWSSEENGVCEEINGLGGMELAMDAWANWVDSNVDPAKKVFFVTMSPTHFTSELSCSANGTNGNEDAAVDVWATRRDKIRNEDLRDLVWMSFCGRQDEGSELRWFILVKKRDANALVRRKGEWEPGSEGNCYNEKLPLNGTYWGVDSDLPTMQMVERTLARLGSTVNVLNITQLSDYRKDGHPSIYRKFWEALTPERLADPASYSDCIHWCLPGVPDVWNELLFQFL